MMENLMLSLGLMWKGMLGVFIVTVLIVVVVVVITKLTSRKKQK